MNIGVDIDGTLTRHPSQLFMLMTSIVKSGGNAYIITGLGYDRAVEKLKKLEEEQDLKGLLNFPLYTSGNYNQRERGFINCHEFFPNEYLVGMFKQRICKELNIDIMFDDKAIVHNEIGEVPVFMVMK